MYFLFSFRWVDAITLNLFLAESFLQLGRFEIGSNLRYSLGAGSSHNLQEKTQTGENESYRDKVGPFDVYHGGWWRLANQDRNRRVAKRLRD